MRYRLLMDLPLHKLRSGCVGNAFRMDGNDTYCFSGDIAIWIPAEIVENSPKVFEKVEDETESKDQIISKIKDFLDRLDKCTIQK